MSLESYFAPFRAGIIGLDQDFATPFGRQRILYADWTASGRMFGPIEKLMAEEIAPFIGNTHTETSVTGSTMTRAYHEALHLIKAHVRADANDAIICYGAGMTAVVNKLQRILGLRVHEKYRHLVQLAPADRPIVFVTHMEHHSNQTSWIESVAEVRVINATADGLVDLAHLDALLAEYRDRRVKKREFRSLWIVRINAAAHLHEMTYSQLIAGLKAVGNVIDRKVLADMAVRDPEGFAQVAKQAKAGLASKPAA